MIDLPVFRDLMSPAIWVSRITFDPSLSMRPSTPVCARSVTKRTNTVCSQCVLHFSGAVREVEAPLVTRSVYAYAIYFAGLLYARAPKVPCVWP